MTDIIFIWFSISIINYKYYFMAENDQICGRLEV